MNPKYDAIVIGGGPGGYEAAIRLAQLGKKTALFEARELGGACLNRGCIPTKALLHCAEVFRQAKDAARFGVTCAPTFDFARMAAFRDETVGRLRAGVAALNKAHGVTVIPAFARLAGPGRVEADGAIYEADDIVLAVGGSPARPPIPGAENALDSDGVLALQACPTSIVLIGGGVIGVEFAALFAGLGARATIVEMAPDILPLVDPDLRALVAAGLRDMGCEIVTGARVTKIEKGEVFYERAGVCARAAGEIVCLCAGRAPNTKDLGLETLGVRTARGYIEVDDRMRASAPHVYAVGDVTGKIQLAHVASAQGLVAAANIAGGDEIMRYDAIPACVYTSPELAYVGMTASEAEKAGRRIAAGSFSALGNGRSLAMGETRGVCKLVCDADTGEILGCGIYAPRASDMIAEICAVMRCEGTLDELTRTVHAHPTLSEMIFEAAHDAQGRCCHKMPGRKR